MSYDFGHSDLIASFSTRFDDYFGVEDELVPQFVQRFYLYLVVVFAAIFAFEIIWSSLITVGNASGVVRSYVAIACGALYRFVDRDIQMFPRMITCAFLHSSAKHVFANSTSLAFSWRAWMQAFDHDPEYHWMLYYLLPAWFFCSVAGSVGSFYTSVGVKGFFTVGASGGTCGVGALITLLQLFRIVNSKEAASERHEGFIIQAFAQIAFACVPAAASDSGQVVDFMSHLSGTAVGLVFAYWMRYAPAQFSEPSLRRFGALLSLLTIGLAILAFSYVLWQGLAGGGQVRRYQRCLMKWFLISDIRLKDTGQRWSVGHVKAISEQYTEHIPPLTPFDIYNRKGRKRTPPPPMPFDISKEELAALRVRGSI